MADVRAGDDFVLEELIQHLHYPENSGRGQGREHRQPHDRADAGLALKQGKLTEIGLIR